MAEHLHRYAVMAADYDPAAAELPASVVARLFAPALVGTTTVSLRCEECGDVATRIVRGRWHQGTLQP